MSTKDYAVQRRFARLIATQTAEVRQDVLLDADSLELQRVADERKAAKIARVQYRANKAKIARLVPATRELLKQIERGARGYVSIKEPTHEFFHAIVSIKRRARFDITIGTSGASIKPGWRLANHSLLLPCLRDEFLVRLAPLVAEAQIIPKRIFRCFDQPEDEIEAEVDGRIRSRQAKAASTGSEATRPDDDGSDDSYCENSYASVLKRDTQSCRYVVCSECSTQFERSDLLELREEDELPLAERKGVIGRFRPHLKW